MYGLSCWARVHRAWALRPLASAVDRCLGACSFSEHLADAAGNERRDVQKRARHRKAAGRREIAWPPNRKKFFLVLAQALEGIEHFAVALDHAAHLVPGGRERVLF